MDQLIQHINSFLPLSGDSIALLADKFQERHYAKKEHLLWAESFANEVHFTLSGLTRTYVLDHDGVEHNLSFAKEDWWFGDLQSFITHRPASYNIQALENTTVLSINGKNWTALTEQAPEFLGYVGLLFRNSMFAQQNRIVQNLSLTAKDRYHAFLDDYPDLSQRIPQKHIASYLGITPEFLSALRARPRK